MDLPTKKVLSVWTVTDYLKRLWEVVRLLWPWATGNKYCPAATVSHSLLKKKQEKKSEPKLMQRYDAVFPPAGWTHYPETYGFESDRLARKFFSRVIHILIDRKI